MHLWLQQALVLVNAFLIQHLKIPNSIRTYYTRSAREDEEFKQTSTISCRLAWNSTRTSDNLGDSIWWSISGSTSSSCKNFYNEGYLQAKLEINLIKGRMGQFWKCFRISFQSVYNPRRKSFQASLSRRGIESITDNFTSNSKLQHNEWG